jgi:cell division transport system permease protein
MATPNKPAPKKPAAPAAIQETRPNFFERWFQAHSREIRSTLGRFKSDPLASLLTALAIGITLALPATLNCLLKNVEHVRYAWQGTVQASLFLKENVSPAAGMALAESLKKNTGVTGTQYISKEAAAEEFKAHSGLSEALDLVGGNPLPAVVVVQGDVNMDQGQLKAVFEGLGKLPEVESASIDSRWLERLTAILDLIQRAVIGLASLLAVAVIVIVGNTIRLDIENRREEIRVMKFLGAPNDFIQRPFLYSGLFFGAAGGLLAWLLSTAAVLTLAGPAARLAGLYNSDYQLQGLGAGVFLLLLVFGVMLGWLGAFVTVARHIRRIEPS